MSCLIHIIRRVAGLWECAGAVLMAVNRLFGVVIMESAFIRVSGFALQAVSLLILTFASSGAAFAQLEGMPAGFVEEKLFSFDVPIAAAAFAPNSTPGNERLYLADKTGRIYVAVNGALQTTPFLDIRSEVNTNTDRGLIAIAVDPRFPAEPYIYFGYTMAPARAGDTETDSPRVVRVERVRADPAKDFNEVLLPREVLLGKNSVPANIAPRIAATSTETQNYASCMTGLTMLQSASTGQPIEDCIPGDGRSHTVGTLIFGEKLPGTNTYPLYASFGDGTDYDKPWPAGLRAQDVRSLAGKVLRVDPDSGEALADNPFYDGDPTSNRSKVWALGFRNPFRLTVNPKNGQAYISDVGTSTFEEINALKGGNFGWPCYEGGIQIPSQCSTAVPPQNIRPPVEGGNTINRENSRYKQEPSTSALCAPIYAAQQNNPQPPARVIPPLFAYEHEVDCPNGKKDKGASVTGIAFYPGTGGSYPDEFKEALFYGDYAIRKVRYLTFDAAGKPTGKDFGKEIAASAQGVVQLLTGPDTNIYELTLDIRTKKSELRRIRYAGGTAPPSVAISANPSAGEIPLTVQFSSAGTNDPNGRPIRFAWDFGDGTSSTQPNPTKIYTGVGTFKATLTVTETVAPFLSASKNLSIRTGVIPPKAFIDKPAANSTYRVGDTISFSGHSEFTGNPQVSMVWSIVLRHNSHEHLVKDIVGSSGSFVVEDHGDNTRYLLCLLADAGGGLKDQKCVDLLPLRADYTFSSSPSGATFQYLVGDTESEVLTPTLARPIVNSTQAIVAPAQFAGQSFKRWNDGSTALTRSFVVGAAPAILTAIYENTLPTAAIKVSAVNGTAPLQVVFDASSSVDPDNEALTYSWDFGEGTASDEQIPTKIFSAPGIYPVKLRVTDVGGGAADASVVIRVAQSAVVTLGKPALAIRISRVRCGGTRSPCRLSQSTKVAVSATLPELQIADVKNAYMILQQQNEKGAWRDIFRRSIALTGTRTLSPRIPLKKLQRGVTYRLAVEIAAGTGAPVRSAYRYVRTI